MARSARGQGASVAWATVCLLLLVAPACFVPAGASRSPVILSFQGEQWTSDSFAVYEGLGPNMVPWPPRFGVEAIGDGLALSPDGQRLAAATPHGIAVYDSEHARARGFVGIDAPYLGAPTELAWSDFGNKVARVMPERLVVAAPGAEGWQVEVDVALPAAGPEAEAGTEASAEGPGVWFAGMSDDLVVVWLPDGRMVAVPVRAGTFGWEASFDEVLAPPVAVPGGFLLVERGPRLDEVSSAWLRFVAAENGDTKTLGWFPVEGEVRAAADDWVGAVAVADAGRLRVFQVERVPADVEAAVGGLMVPLVVFAFDGKDAARLHATDRGFMAWREETGEVLDVGRGAAGRWDERLRLSDVPWIVPLVEGGRVVAAREAGHAGVEVFFADPNQLHAYRLVPLPPRLVAKVTTDGTLVVREPMSGTLYLARDQTPRNEPPWLRVDPELRDDCARAARRPWAGVEAGDHEGRIETLHVKWQRTGEGLFGPGAFGDLRYSLVLPNEAVQPEVPDDATGMAWFVYDAAGAVAMESCRFAGGAVPRPDDVPVLRTEGPTGVPTPRTTAQPDGLEVGRSAANAGQGPVASSSALDPSLQRTAHVAAWGFLASALSALGLVLTMIARKRR